MTSFFSQLWSGDPVALLLFAVFIGFVAYLIPTQLKKAKERAEIAQHNEAADTAELNSRSAKEGTHPLAVPAISQARALTQIELGADRVRRDDGLEGATTVQLSLHQIIERQQDRLKGLIDDRDAETHPEKRADLEDRIRDLREELRAQRQQAVVQAGGRSGVRQSDEDTDEPGSRQSRTEEDAEPFSATGSRSR